MKGQISVTKLWIVIGLLFCLTSLAGCDEEGLSPADHEVMTKFDMGYSGPVGVKKNGTFSFDLCLYTYVEPLSKVTIKATLPPELKLLEGDLRWKGDMPSRHQRCLTLKAHSRTNWKQWSAPIRMHAEFLYKGEKIVGDYRWSYQDEEKKSFEAAWRKNGKVITNF